MVFSAFTYRSNFSGLTDAQVTAAISVIETMYYGVCFEFWSGHPKQDDLRTLAENLLVAWYLANTNPTSVTGVDANGQPMVSKSIGGTSVSFANSQTQNGMENLMTNTFGRQAYQMIQSAPELYQVYG